VVRLDVGRGIAELRPDAPPTLDFAHNRIPPAQEPLRLVQVAKQDPLADERAADAFAIDQDRRYLCHLETMFRGFVNQQLIVASCVLPKAKIVADEEASRMTTLCKDFFNKCDWRERRDIAVERQEKNGVDPGIFQELQFLRLAGQEVRRMVR
jgi:hypothetical protein